MIYILFDDIIYALINIINKRGDYMSKNESEKETLETIIAQINELLETVKNEQIKLKKEVENNHKINMQKFSKLIYYGKHIENTNKILEEKVSSIEKLLYEVFKS